MKKTLHVDDPQAAVRVRGGRCEVIRDEQQVASVPLKLIDCVLVQTASELPLHALRHLLQAGARVVLLDEVGRCVGRLEPVVRHLPERLLAQCAASTDPRLRLGVARRIVAAKLHNQAVLLRDRSRRTEVEAVLRRANGQIGALA